MDSLGHVYSKHKCNASKTKTYWKCGRRLKLEDWKCPARVTTEGIYIIKRVGEHSHLPNVMR